jgi:hypothetical protein
VGLSAWGFGFARMIGADRPLSELVRYNGLLVQMPMLCLAGVGLRRVWERSPEYAGIRVGALAGAAFLALAVALGIASDSGFGVQANLGVHWGPRVLLPAMPALAALAMAAVRSEALGPAPRLVRSTRIAWALLVVAGLLSSAHATWFLAQQKLESRRFQSALTALRPRFAVTVVPMLAQQLSRVWNEKPMLLVQDPRSLQRLVRAMPRRSVREFLFIAPEGAAPLSGIPGLDCQLAESHRGRHLHYLDLDIQRCAIRARVRRTELLDGRHFLHPAAAPPVAGSDPGHRAPAAPPATPPP